MACSANTQKADKTVSSVAMQAASLDIWDKKYRLKNKNGTAADQDIDATYRRIAHALAEIEKPEYRKRYYEEFLWALRHGAIPAGRIISNAGAQNFKPATSTVNCTVSGTIDDSMDAILQKLHEAGLTLKSGAGIGYEFSTLRPRHAYVSGAGAYTSGPLSFMDIYDKMCFTISSAGGRRGAQMATFDVAHPDVMDFIQAKREHGRLRQFNLSLLISDDFMRAVREDKAWPLLFPLTQEEIASEKLNLDDNERIRWRTWPLANGYVRNEAGEIACRVYKTLPARSLWDAIMRSNYDYAEPGFILIDRYNELNNNWFCEDIRATNPCGEQGLPPYGACLLGSVNLACFVHAPFTTEAAFDWEAYRKLVTVFTRMLDNVVEINALPLTGQREEIFRKRRHGMGFLGLGTAMVMLSMSYGNAKSLAFVDQVSRELALSGWRAALALSQEKGPAPIMEETFAVDERMLRRRPEMYADGWRVGDQVAGKILHARYSRYMQRIAKLDPHLIDQLAEVGARFTHHSSIAPTGTIALSLANNVSNGIEPSFAHHYARNIIREGKKSKDKVEVFSYELLAYRHYINPHAMPDSDKPEERLPAYFSCTDTLTPQQHIDVQAAAQQWIDSSISKTINVPTDFPFEAFKDVYWYAYEKGLKGCTVFRYNPEAFQSVLVKERDLESTSYCFTLEDGSVMEAKGNQQVEYEGELHTAANLYEALKEGYYGKF